MEKNITENPFNADNENDTFVNKNDISKNRKNTKGFTASEEIPDNTPFDPFEREQESFSDSDEEDSEIETNVFDEFSGEALEEQNAEESDRRKMELLKQEIKFRQTEGTASLYTEDSEEETRHSISSLLEKPKKIDEFEAIEKETTPRISRRKTDTGITSMSHEQISRESHAHPIIKSRKEERRYDGKGNTGTEHDNLKTMSGSEKSRTFARKIRDFFTTQNNEETPIQVLEQRFDESEHEEDKAA